MTDAQKIQALTATVAALRSEIRGATVTIALLVKQLGGTVRIPKREFFILEPQTLLDVERDIETGDLKLHVRLPGGVG